MKTFKILSINISEKTGEQKRPVPKAELRADHGLVGDAHAGDWLRQVSLLAQEDVDTMIEKGAKVGPGDFAENITTQGINLASLPIGAQLKIGDAVLAVSQIGKECHQHCAIYRQAGDCVMPRKGIFAKVIKGGEISNESIGAYDF